MRFDIIMPTFRREHCIHDTINTIIAQTYTNWRLIIIDNYGSNYQFNDNRILYITRTENNGASWGRNIGLNYSENDFVCFFDDDDYMLPNYLEFVYAVFKENPNCKMVNIRIDANFNKPKLRFATPCCVLKREFATPTWTNAGQLHDQKYFKSIITKNNWEEGYDFISINKILACVGHSDKGGLRHTEGQL